jgi:L-fuconolactonase
MNPRIDAHQHFWSLSRGDYGWLTPELEPLYRDFLPPDLKPLLGDAGIDRTVVVQAAPTVAETRYLLDLAGSCDFIAGIVGWVDMAAGEDAAAELEELAADGHFVGIRPMLQDLPDPAWITRPALAPVSLALVDKGLCFDALVRPLHLPYLLQYLERYPDLKVVVDHGAKPDIARMAWQPWATAIANVAEHTDAYCKISGLTTEASRAQRYDDLVPYLDHLLEAFGPARLMWGSDWPVLNLAGDYTGWHRATRNWIARLSSEERAGIEGLNAERFYGLAENRNGG